MANGWASTICQATSGMGVQAGAYRPSKANHSGMGLSPINNLQYSTAALGLQRGMATLYEYLSIYTQSIHSGPLQW
jgi:hypothetical protein